MPDVRTDAPTDQNLTKLQPNDSIVVNFGVSPTAEGSASSAHGQFLAVLTQPNGTGNAVSDALSPVYNVSKVRPTTLQQHTSESLSPVPPLHIAQPTIPKTQ